LDRKQQKNNIRHGLTRKNKVLLFPYADGSAKGNNPSKLRYAKKKGIE
jgi:hypothetical protein